MPDRPRPSPEVPREERALATICQPVRGTGLDLSMARGLAAQLGGALAIRSRPGLGTKVERWLPATEAEAPSDADAPGWSTLEGA